MSDVLSGDPYLWNPSKQEMIRSAAVALAGFGLAHLGVLSWSFWADGLLSCWWNGWSLISWQDGSVSSLYPSMELTWLYNEPDYGLSAVFFSPRVAPWFGLSLEHMIATAGLRKRMGSCTRSRGKDRSTSSSSNGHPLKTWLQCFSSSAS